MNRGAQLLADQLRGRGDQSSLARSLGIDQGNLSWYARGETTPGLKTRALFEDHCAIPMRSWDEPPHEAPPVAADELVIEVSREPAA